MLKPEKDRFVIAVLQHLTAHGASSIRALAEDLDVSYWAAARAVASARQWELVRTVSHENDQRPAWLMLVPRIGDTEFVITNAGRQALRSVNALDLHAPHAACE
jgi:hypothetical protein